MGPERLRPVPVTEPKSWLGSVCSAPAIACLPAFLCRLPERVQEGSGSLGGWCAAGMLGELHPPPASFLTPLCPTEDQQLPGG